MGGKREVRMIEGKRMEHLEDDKREKGAKRGEKLEGRRKKMLKREGEK